MRPDESPAPTPATSSASLEAAAGNIVRSQIDTVYAEAARREQADESHPYHRTHGQVEQPTAKQWKQYHSAWQSYYQQYYERYYAGHLHQAHQALATEQAKAAEANQAATAEDSLTEEEALYDLRSRLLSNVQKKAHGVRKSRHFIPLTSALLVMMLFGFLQYNQVIMANVRAYVSPGDIDPQNIIVDPTASLKVGPESKIIIPKINVDVPVDYSAKPNHDSQMAAMKNGLAYFGIPGANSKPGQVGNTPIAGHSTNDLIDPGNYKFIFAQLDKLKKGDTIYAHYKGVRYTYVVTKTEVVLPSQVNRLIYKTDKPMLTLITCTPLGTALKRLLVTAEQISPSPKTATKAPSSTSSSEPIPDMAGTEPTIFERLFGRR